MTLFQQQLTKHIIDNFPFFLLSSTSEKLFFVKQSKNPLSSTITIFDTTVVASNEFIQQRLDTFKKSIL